MSVVDHKGAGVADAPVARIDSARIVFFIIVRRLIVRCLCGLRRGVQFLARRNAEIPVTTRQGYTTAFSMLIESSIIHNQTFIFNHYLLVTVIHKQALSLQKYKI